MAEVMGRKPNISKVDMMTTGRGRQAVDCPCGSSEITSRCDTIYWSQNTGYGTDCVGRCCYLSGHEELKVPDDNQVERLSAELETTNFH
jgi:hypothetical protein